jgi:hypothetical protein
MASIWQQKKETIADIKHKSDRSADTNVKKLREACRNTPRQQQLRGRSKTEIDGKHKETQ